MWSFQLCTLPDSIVVAARQPMTIKTLEQLMLLRRELAATIKFHKTSIALAKHKYKAMLSKHNKAVAKQRARLSNLPKTEDKPGPSTLRRWARADRHGNFDPE